MKLAIKRLRASAIFTATLDLIETDLPIIRNYSKCQAVLNSSDKVKIQFRNGITDVCMTDDSQEKIHFVYFVDFAQFFLRQILSASAGQKLKWQQTIRP